MAAIMTIVVLSGIALILALGASLLSLGDLEMSYIFSKGEDAFFIAESCLEEVLRRICYERSYGLSQGQIGLSLPNGSCIIEIIETGADQRRIVAYGTSTSTETNWNKKIEADISFSSGFIAINSWQELDN